MTRVVFVPQEAAPRCFTQEDWRRWREAARHPALRDPRTQFTHHCTDCTPEYQAEMRAKALCSNPFGQVTRDQDGFIQITPPEQTT